MDPQKRGQWLHSVPALIAVSVGVIYGIGAITIYGQIKGSGINAVETMGIIPIEQILSRGIGSIVSEFGQMALSLAFSLPVLWALWRESNQGARRGLSQYDIQPKTVLIIIGSMFFLLAISSPMKEVLVGIIGIAVTAGTAVLMMRLADEREIEGGRRIVAIVAVAALTVNLSLSLGNSFIRPVPLPSAKLMLSDNRALQGGLITNSDGYWFLARDDGVISAISTRKAQEAKITHPSREPEQSLLDWILGRPPSKLLGDERE